MFFAQKAKKAIRPTKLNTVSFGSFFEDDHSVWRIFLTTKPAIYFTSYFTFFTHDVRHGKAILRNNSTCFNGFKNVAAGIVGYHGIGCDLVEVYRINGVGVMYGNALGVMVKSEFDFSGLNPIPPPHHARVFPCSKFFKAPTPGFVVVVLVFLYGPVAIVESVLARAVKHHLNLENLRVFSELYRSGIAPMPAFWMGVNLPVVIHAGNGARKQKGGY